MLKSRIILFFLLMTGSVIQAKQADHSFSTNAVFLEIGGIGIYDALYYERTLLPLSDIGVYTIRTGFTFIPDKKYAPTYGGSAFLSTVLGRTKSKIEVGVGYGFHLKRLSYVDQPSEYMYRHGICVPIYYRYQALPRGFDFRIGFTPVYVLGDLRWTATSKQWQRPNLIDFTGAFLPLIGASFGVCF